MWIKLRRLKRPMTVCEALDKRKVSLIRFRPFMGRMLLVACLDFHSHPKAGSYCHRINICSPGPHFPIHCLTSNTFTYTPKAGSYCHRINTCSPGPGLEHATWNVHSKFCSILKTQTKFYQRYVVCNARANNHEYH